MGKVSCALSYSDHFHCHPIVEYSDDSKSLMSVFVTFFHLMEDATHIRSPL